MQVVRCTTATESELIDQEKAEQYLNDITTLQRKLNIEEQKLTLLQKKLSIEEEKLKQLLRARESTADSK